jgi:penicillin-binding protein 1C
VPASPSGATEAIIAPSAGFGNLSTGVKGDDDATTPTVAAAVGACIAGRAQALTQSSTTAAAKVDERPASEPTVLEGFARIEVPPVVRKQKLGLAPPTAGRRADPTVALAMSVTVIVLGVVLFVLRPIGAGEFGGGANALTFEDRAGAPLGTILARDSEHAVRVPLERVAPVFLAAIVATEDRRFYAHDGVDGIALGRALSEALQRGRFVSGGSTITMQLARLRYGLPHSLPGKVAEAALALRIERGMSKGDILAAYVNRLPMGGDLIGVEAGARTYFGTAASDLDLAQAALLAALPNDPVRLDPYAHRAALEARRRMILARMASTGAVPAADAAHAATETVAVLPRSDGIFAAPHLLLRLAGSVAPQTTRVRTTLDRDLQAFVENATAHVVGTLSERGARDAAAIVIDNRDGGILAYVGSADYFAHDRDGKNDGVTALRQPGSTLKPFLYELAFERRVVRPTTILPDVPTSYAIPGLRSFTPNDYSDRFAGPVRARIALADSLNVPAVRVLSDVGVPAFLDRLRALGFVHLDRQPAYYGLGLALGDGEVNLEELVRAYATIARGGVPPHVHAVANADANAADVAATPIGSAASWSLVTDILSDAHARARAFGVASLLRTSFPSAVKTGTSSDFRDTWTVGFTRDDTVATWVGNFDGAPMRRVSGVTGAAPLWHRIIAHLAERAAPAALAAPRGYVRKPICTTTGVRPTRDCPTVVDEWLDRDDLRTWRSAPRPLERTYDAWLAAQPQRPGEPLRIVSPHDGDIFVSAPNARIAVIARGPVAPLWELNGRRCEARTTHWLLTLKAGRWTLRARAGARTDSVQFTVIAPPRSTSRQGFTTAG